MRAVVVQARLDSTRLPGKSLMPLQGEPLIFRVLEALNRIPADFRILACPEDCEKKFAHIASRAGFRIVAGPKEDVLARYCKAIKLILAEQPALAAENLRIIRATGDNPFTFADAAVRLNAEAEADGADYAGYLELPYGAGVESVKASALLKADAEARDPCEREHVCPYLYRHPEVFRLYRPSAPPEWNAPELRLTVDTQEDFENAEKRYAALTAEYGKSDGRYCGKNIIFAQKRKRFLIVPATSEGRGGGHLARCTELCKEIQKEGGSAELYQNDDASEKKYDLIVLDTFKTSESELKRWQNCGPVVGIDEGGCRERFDFLIDLLPLLPEVSPPNLSRPDFLPVPTNRRKFLANDTNGTNLANGGLKVLVTFGAEDAAGLTVPTSLMFSGSGAEVTAVFGPLNKNAETGIKRLKDAGIRALKGAELKEELRETFADYGLVVAHFGLSAFEALGAGVPVLLASPTRYHEKLARFAGFASVGFGKRGIKRIPHILFSGGKINAEKFEDIAEKSARCASRWNIACSSGLRGLARLLLSWQPAVRRDCPACASAERKLLGRFADRTCWQCSKCGLVSLDRTAPPPQDYGEAYFFADYQKQYGKTYLEDFNHLKELAGPRINILKQLIAAPNSQLATHNYLLDIGCAYGPFLAAARDAGFAAAGFDPSEGAVKFVRNELGISTAQGFFPDDAAKINALKPAAGKFGAATMWYVIEHIVKLREALVEANKLLETGGVFAFSTPSCAGVSRRKSLNTFLEKSPADHWTIWSPRRCKKILSAFGFKVKKIAVTGHHPERFFNRRFTQIYADSFFYKLIMLFSRIFGLGDTFECYAVKVKEL